MIKKTLLLIFASISLMAAPPPTPPANQGNNSTNQNQQANIDYMSYGKSMCGTSSRENFTTLNFYSQAKMTPELAQDFSGFWCPPLPVSDSNDETKEIYITAVNLESGEYTCGYATASSKLEEEAQEMTEQEMISSGLKEVKYVNSRCQLELYGDKLTYAYTGPFWFKTQFSKGSIQMTESTKQGGVWGFLNKDLTATYPTGKIAPTGVIKFKDSSGVIYNSAYIGTEPMTTSRLNEGWIVDTVDVLKTGTLNFETIDKAFFDLRTSIVTLVEETANGNFVESRDKKYVFGSPGVYALNTNEHSKKNKFPTVSELLAKTIVLDPDLIGKGNGGRILNAFGGLEIENGWKYKSSTSGTTWFTGEPSETSRNLWQRIFGDAGDITILNNLDTFLHAKFWGFYISFIENMRIAEQSVVFYLFFAGFLLFIGQKILQGLQGFFGDNESKQKFSISKIIVGPVLSLLVFTAPLVRSDLKLPCEFIKPGGTTVKGYISLSNNSNNANTPLTFGVNSQCYNKQANSNTTAFDYNIMGSTLIQSAIRYFVNYGQLIANDFADYGLYTYLNYLRIREGGTLGEAISVFNGSIIDNKKDFIVLSRTYKFYSTFCKPYYNKIRYPKGKDAASLFTTEPLAGKTSLQLKRLTENASNEDLKKIFQPKLGWTAPTAQLCASLENKIEETTQKAISKFVFLKESIDTINAKMSAEYPGLFAKSQQTTADFATGGLSALVENMTETQKTLGWIYSAAVPISHTLFYSRDLSDAIEKKQQKVKKYVKSSTKNAKEKEIDDEVGWLTHMMQTFVPSTMYFLLPGFNSLYLGIVNTIGDAITTIRDVIYNISIIGSVIPYMGWMFTVLMSSLNVVLGAASPVAKWVGGFYLATMLYNILLQFITCLSITLMLIFKIAMYYVEMMVFFVASPCVVIWAVVTRRAEVIWHYIGRAAILTITPLLIVLSCYIYMFAGEIVTSIYAIMSGTLASTFITPQSSFVQNAIIFMICGVGNAILLAVHIIIGFTIIIKFNNWFLETVGAKASAMDNAAEEFTQQARRYYSMF